MSSVVATVGAIPGAGATTVVAALGSALAEQRHHVALVDASPDGSRLDDVISVDGDGRLADALRRSADLADVQASGPHGTTVLPAASDTNWEALRPGAVASMYDELRDRFEYVLVDCGYELTPATASWLGYADELVIVTDPDVADAVADRAAVAEALDVELRGLVANRVIRDEAAEAGAKLDETGEQVLAVLPEDPTVDAAAQAGNSVFAEHPDSQIASCAWELGRCFAVREHGEPVVPEGWVDDAAGSGGAAPDDAGAAGDPADTSGGAAGAQGESPATRDDPTGPGDDATADTPTQSADGGPVGSAGTDASEPTAGTTDGGDAGSVPSAGSDDAGSDEGSSGASLDGVDDGDLHASVSDLGGGDDEFEFTAGSDDGDAPSDRDLGLGDSDGAAVPGLDREPDEGDADGRGGGAASTDDATDDAADGVAGAHGDAGSDGDGGSDGAEISDEQIEEVFKETMQQVKEEKRGEDADDDDDSVLGGFVG